jgi:hypothetical protein
MDENQVTGIAERMNEDELVHWKNCYRAALRDCFRVAQKPMCAELAAHIADLSIMEYRKRLNGRDE